MKNKFTFAVLFIFFLSFLQQCTTQRYPSIVGDWELISNDTIKEFTEYTKILTFYQEKNKLNVLINFKSEEYSPDKTDQLVVDYPKMSFRSLNEDGTFNHYTIQLTDSNYLLVDMKSYNDNIYHYKAKKIHP